MEIDNKNIFASNLNRLMVSHRKSRKDLSDALGISYFTITAWVNGTKYPRMDKVEMLANYFGVLKSDLIEEKGNINSIPPLNLQLFGQGSSEAFQLSEGEKKLVELFRLVPEEQQEMVLNMIRVALNRKE